MEPGAGWTAANNWQGDYNPKNPGNGQNYTPGPADIGGAHTYLSNPGQRMVQVLDMLRGLALLVTPGKPVAHTEVGAYLGAKLTPEVYGQFMVMGALDSALAGDVGFLIYGLQDSAPEATYGFYTYPGGIAHPVAEYFHTLTQLLSSAKGIYGPGASPSFKVKPLNASFSNQAVSHLVMQKPTGEYIIAAWSEQLMTGAQHDVTDTIRFGAKFRTVKVYDVQNGPAPIATLRNASECALTLHPSDTYLVIGSR